MCVGPVEYSVESESKNSSGHSIGDAVEFYAMVIIGLGFVAWLFWFANRG
jgi:hypothetical protein